MIHLLIIPLMVLASAFPAFAQETLPGTNVLPPPTNMPAPTGTMQPPQNLTQPGGGTKPPQQNIMPPGGQGTMPQPMRASTTGALLMPPRNGTSTLMQERKDLFLENQAERKEFRQEVGSTTRAALMERRELLPLGPISSSTREAILEKREMFPNLIGSTTRGIMLERRDAFLGELVDRREAFASSTAAKILDMRENKGERMEHFASSTALTKGEFSDEMKARILAQAEHAAELLDAMLGRLAGIAERIAGRIEELAAAGVDTVTAEAQLAEAYDAISAAEAAVADVKTKVGDALESDTPQEMLRAAKAAGDAAKEALRAAHEALKEAALALPKPEETNS